MITIFMARHGESKWNVKGLLQGQSFPAENTLTKKGVAQAKMLAKELKHIRFDAIISSDLLRAKQTAEIIALEHKLTLKTERALREKSHGEFEGTSSAEYLKLFKKWAEMSDKERFRYKVTQKGESPHEAIKRMVDFFKKIRMVYNDKTLLIVTHGGLIRDFLIYLGYTTFDACKGVENTGYIKIETDCENFFVKEVKGLKMN